MYGAGCRFTYSIQLALVSTLSGAPPSTHPSPCVKRNVGASAFSRKAVSPRTTAASVAFSKAITSAIAALSALPGAGVPGGTRLAGALVFGRQVGSLADCAVSAAISTAIKAEDMRTARMIKLLAKNERPSRPPFDRRRRSTTRHERSRGPSPVAAPHDRSDSDIH